MTELIAPTPRPSADTPRAGLAWSLAGLAVLGAGLLWSFWPTLGEMAHRWQHDTRYSHGYLVPMFSAYLLWARRRMMAAPPSRASWLGVLLLAAGAAVRLAGTYTFYMYFDLIGFLICVAGVAALLGGVPTLRWAWPSVAFLGLMLPLPYRLEGALGEPLQQLATLTSTYLIQMLGLPALAEGNVIYMPETTIGVVEACSGLGMLYTFVAITTATAILVHRPLPDRLAIVLSAIPIAVAANVARITITGVLSELVGGKAAHLVFHDLAGWLMMPLSLLLLMLELRWLSLLLVEDEPAGAEPLRVMAVPGLVSWRGGARR